MQYLGIYLVSINIIGFVVCWFDKRAARRDAQRVPEKRLFGIAALGGAVGVWAAMYAFRHKTKHISFVIGIPAIAVIEYGLIIYYLMK